MQMIIPPAAAESVFSIGHFSITNSLINGWIAVIFFVVVALVLRKRQNAIPKGIQNFAEATLEFMLTEIQKVTGDAKRARQFLPIIGTLFLFILFSNWIGLFPGTGSIGVWGMHHGAVALIPLLRPAASDMNFTLAIAAFAVITSHVIGFRNMGGMNHFSKFINIRGLWRGLKKGPIAFLVAIIELVVGLIETIGEISKVASLSLRLFGNIFAGEVLITVILGLFAFFMPIPFMFLEILVGAVQATVFSMLTLAYLTVATTPHDHEEEHDESHEPHTEPSTAHAA